MLRYSTELPNDKNHPIATLNAVATALRLSMRSVKSTIANYFLKTLKPQKPFIEPITFSNDFEHITLDNTRSLAYAHVTEKSVLA